MTHINVDQDHCPSPHSVGNKLGRVLWAIVWTLLFRPSPRIFFGWRRLLLRLFGSRVGKNARISPSVRVWAPWNLSVGDEAAIAHDVDVYCVGPITIGHHATVSQYSYLCAATHSITDPHMKLIAKPIVISDQSWVCAKALIGPGVTVGVGAVVGAGAVAMKDVAPWTVVAGNPAVVIKQRSLETNEK